MIRPGFRCLLLACAVGLFLLLINRPILGFDWVYFDDDINILLNPHLTGDIWATARWAWTDLEYTRRYMPLGWMMFDGLLACGGLNAAVFHFAAWLLSAANGVLLFQIIRKVVPIRDESSGWQDTCSCIAVVLLSAHPWRAETTGWSSGLLYLAGQFLTSLAVLVSWQPNRPVRSQVLSALLFLLALLVYPVFLSAPLAMILVEAGLRNTTGGARQRWLAAIQRYGGWLIVALGIGALNWFASSTSRQGFAAVEILGSYSIQERWTHFVTLSGHYLGRLFWPDLTAPFYGTSPQLAAPPVTKMAAWTALVVWIGLLIRPRTRQRACLLAGLFAACLLPFIACFELFQTANDRFVFLLLAVATALLARLMAQAPGGRLRFLTVVGATALLAVLLPAYRQALTVWTDTAHLQARIDRVNASHPNAQLNYAKPAITAWLLGDPEKSSALLGAGLSRLGPRPEILSAVEFIRQADERMAARLRHDPLLVPYALLHLELAQAQRAGGHPRAAVAHELFAGRLEKKARSIPSSP